ncbi:MAG TPA: nucleotide exchange factor GrpE [Candidatus Kapabacteria bacterium]|nr:nucleotide exchange factor GrpE [Candidatus Kapabacteria bacterium]
MEESSNAFQKPLRAVSNKIKDLQNTYGKGSSQTKNSEGDQEKINKENQANIESNYDLENDRVIELEQEIITLNDTIAQLNEQISIAQKEKDDLKDQFIRKAAEFENFRRRTLDEKKEIIDFANEKLLAKMVDILDDFNSATEAGKNTNDIDAMNKGLDMINNKTKKIFEEAGVTKMLINAGDEFDVNFHEALMVMNSEYPEGCIAQVVQTGYLYNNKVLRFAKVVTSTGNKG